MPYEFAGSTNMTKLETKKITVEVMKGSVSCST